MEKKIYEKPVSEVIDMVPLDSLLGVSIPKGEGTPPGTAEAPVYHILSDMDLDDDDDNVATHNDYEDFDLVRW
jgi:hypothetical protein